MTKLIVNADDFGYSRGVNYGIIDAHTYGIVNSATMLMNAEGTNHAIELAKLHPTLGVGVHLALDIGKPLCKDVSSLTDKEGSFLTFKEVIAKQEVNEEELEREWSAQIEKFLATGLPLTHLDSHHHNHQLPWIAPVTTKLAKKYNVPIRLLEPYPYPTTSLQHVPRFADTCLGDFYDDGVTFDFFEMLPKRVKDLASVEIMCHPAYLDKTLAEGSSYVEKRIEELHILTTVELPPTLTLEKYQTKVGLS